MMRLSCVALSLAAALAGPVRAQTTLSLPLDGATLENLTYFCDKGAMVEVRYLNAGPNSLALLPLDGEQRIFVNVIAASGARYVSGEYEWWTKGRSATLTNAMNEAETQSCVETD
ncbi:MliC family protein [uncultured Paracoccus sp.]|uniref:MliC family protein n=1 Tax=uncultured Paracoccus sp. TaxID=189685 RepID=UPI0025DCD4F5|nr:MliC family protein [uncultured Paracoccus sp.]